MAWFSSYFSSTWSLIIVVAVLVAALVLLAVMVRNIWAIIAALVLLAAGFAYAQIDRNAYQRAAAEHLAEQIKAKDQEIRARDAQIAAAHERINVLNAANEQDAFRALADADELSKLKALINETPPDAAVALKRDAARRLRAFRRAAAGRPGAVSGVAAGPGRH